VKPGPDPVLSGEVNATGGGGHEKKEIDCATDIAKERENQIGYTTQSSGEFGHTDPLRAHAVEWEWGRESTGKVFPRGAKSEEEM